MYYDKQKYVALIMDSPLFSLDRDVEASAYKRESYKMVEYVYCYLMAVNETAYDQFACEIMETTTRCIRNFDNSKGVFLHYFNAAWKQEYSHLVGDKLIDERLRGIKITEEEKRNIRKYLRLAEKKQSTCSSNELYERIASAMQLSVEKVRLIAEIGQLRVCSDTLENDDGENLSVWDQISDGKSFEDELETMDSIEVLFSTIETAFNSLQDRQKPIVSDMLTARIWSLLSSHQGSKYRFISNEVFDECKKTGQAPTQKTIAKKYNRDEASISRTVKDFQKKLKTILSEV